MEKVDVIKAVNNQLSNFWWGGEIVDIRKNEWNEWIADCKIFLIGEWGDKWYNSGDFIIKQYMVHFTELSDITICHLYEAKDNKRLPTATELCGLFDKYAPESPYISIPSV